MKQPLLEKNITMQYDDAALAAIAEDSYGKPYGARDIRRVIRQTVEDQVASLIIAQYRRDSDAAGFCKGRQGRRFLSVSESEIAI